MKNKGYQLFILFTLFFAECTKETPAPVVGETTVLRASVEDFATRTEIDGSKILWTQSDAINVNGQISEALTLSGPSASADFSFSSSISAPYSAVYPASLYKDATTLTLPGEWSLDNFSIPLIAYSASAASLQFKPLVTLVKLPLTGEEGTVLREVILKGRSGEQLSGDFSVDYVSGTLVGASTAAADTQVKVSGPVSLSSTPVVVYIPVPARTYPAGYQVEMITEDGNIMRKTVSSAASLTLTAGELRTLSQTAFAANVGIANAADLVAFRDAVNAGESTAQWENADGVVTVIADIDCATITSWTPIGNCTMPTWGSTSLVTDGVLFQGAFDGRNHSFKNLNLSFEPSAGNTAWGLFGAVGKGGSVKNITFDSTCSMNISTGVSGAFGMLAGLVVDASVENVKNYAPVTGGGTSNLAVNTAAGRVIAGGLIGEIHAVEEAPRVKDLYNAGQIGTAESPFTKGPNTGNGANGVMIGGVVGFSTNNNNTVVQYLSDLVNDGDIYSDAGRTSGVVSTCNRYTHLSSATNNGNVYVSHSSPSNFRPGNITCFAGPNVELEDCVNKGDLIAPGTESTAGVVCYINGASIKLTRCKSIGATIVGKYALAASATNYNGVLFGRCNVADTEFTGCSISGKVGSTLDDLVTLTAENYFQYVGINYKSANSNITSSNITFASE